MYSLIVNYILIFNLYTLIYGFICRCSSPVGKRSGGRSNVIRLANGCGGLIPAHEIFHSLGRFHEQSRPDRDYYVKIITKNIKQSQ